MQPTEPQVFHVPSLVHGRVLIEAPPAPAALLVGFHGYAQVGEDTLAFLRLLAGERLAAAAGGWALGAPQALHPFYRPRDQAVVAGWMTRQDRELAVEDNVAYTARAVSTLRARLPSARKLAIIGFSQGVAMAWRTAVRCGQRVDAVVALAGDLPVELHADAFGPWGCRPAVLIGRGSGEEWYTEEKLAGDLEALAALGLPAEVCRFEGGHEWAPAFVERAAAFLAERLG
jgi:predicted esterase